MELESEIVSFSIFTKLLDLIVGILRATYSNFQ